MPQEQKRNDEDLLRSMSTMDGLNDHDIETCGVCYTNFLYAQVAREMVEAGDTGKGSVGRWADETQKRWRDSKFFKLWQEEQAAGRNPADAFKQRGWEP